MRRAECSQKYVNPQSLRPWLYARVYNTISTRLSESASEPAITRLSRENAEATARPRATRFSRALQVPSEHITATLSLDQQNWLYRHPDKTTLSTARYQQYFFHILAHAGLSKGQAPTKPIPVWSLQIAEYRQRPCTRPPRSTLSPWDVRVARFTSPRYSSSTPSLLSPLEGSPRGHASRATQTTALNVAIGTQTTQSDSEWEGPSQTSIEIVGEALPPTPPESPERSYTPPPLLIAERSYTPPLPTSLYWTKSTPIISWKPKAL